MPIWAFTPESICGDDVLQRLFDGDDRAGHLRQLLADVGQDLLAAAVRVRVEGHDDLRHVHALGVLVEFGSARAAAEGDDAGNLLQPGFDHAGDAVGGLQRVAGRQHDVDLDGSLVEGRQKVAAEPRHGEAARHDGDGDSSPGSARGGGR